MAETIRSMHTMQPTLVFTLATQTQSIQVLERLSVHVAVRKFGEIEEVLAYFSQEGPSAVALFDDTSCAHGFSLSGAHTYFPRIREIKWITCGLHRRIPLWAIWQERNQWAVGIHQPGMSSVRQIYHDFFVRFEAQIAAGKFPWGNPRKGESGHRTEKSEEWEERQHQRWRSGRW